MHSPTSGYRATCNGGVHAHITDAHIIAEHNEDGGADGGRKRSTAAYSTMIDADTMSFAGSYDYRINTTETAAALGVEKDSLCFPILVYNPKTPVTPKNYADLCDNPDHGDFGSEIHTKTVALKEKFASLELIDYSHKPDADTRTSKKGGKGKGSKDSRNKKKGGKSKGKGRGGKRPF